MEIDSCWNAERIVIALNKFGLADDIRQILPDKIKMTCVCGHRDFAIFTNSGMISCLDLRASIQIISTIYGIFRKRNSC